MTFTQLEIALDPLFIWMFRIPAPPLVAFALGLAIMALVLTMIGELSLAGAYFLNRKHFARIHREMVRNNNNSVRALARADKKSYTACNAMANEAFGQNFFSGLALFAASVWPVAFAMGWLSLRYGAVEFPLPFVERTVGPNFYFVPLYIAVRIAFSFAKPYLPVYSRIQKAVKANQDPGERMLTWGDLVQKPPREEHQG